MRIVVNGEPCEVSQQVTIAELLQQRELRTEGVAVAVNLEFVPRPLHARRLLCEGDEVEIVAPICGG